MKKNLSFFVFGLAAATFECCSPEELESPAFQDVQFVLAPGDPDASLPTEITPGLTVRVTIETTDGDPIAEDQSLQLSPAADGLVTESIRLPRGGYVISRFEVVDRDAEALYSAPDAVTGKLTPPADGVCAKIVMHLQPCHGGYAAKGRLKEFVFRDRHYNFFYSARGKVDSLVCTDSHNHYVYRVVYTRGRIDSVGTYDRGEYVSVNKDFTFNHRRQVTSFNYYFRFPDAPPDLAFPVDLQYDYKGRVVYIGGASLRYNRFNNVVEYSGSAYTYDGGKNPFGGVDDLAFIMVEEHWIWQYIFSKNNPVTRLDSEGNTFHFTNVYDSRGRLVSSGEMLFSYY